MNAKQFLSSYVEDSILQKSCENGWKVFANEYTGDPRLLESIMPATDFDYKIIPDDNVTQRPVLGDSVIVKKSSFPAGAGVFAGKEFKPEEYIMYVFGEVIEW